MVVKCRPSPPLNLLGRGGRESGESLSALHHHRVSGVETVFTLYERANIDIYALLLNSKNALYSNVSVFSARVHLEDIISNSA